MMHLLRNKKGSTSMLLPMFMFLGFLFIALIVDIGKVYLARTQIQNIADAASIGGASYGMYAYYSIADNQPRAVIRRDSMRGERGALPKVYEIVNENISHLPDYTVVTDLQVNPSGHEGLTELEQYYNGDLNVFVEASSFPTFMGNLLINDQNVRIQIPFFTTKKHAKTHVEPVVVP